MQFGSNFLIALTTIFPLAASKLTIYKTWDNTEGNGIEYLGENHYRVFTTEATSPASVTLRYDNQGYLHVDKNGGFVEVRDPQHYEKDQICQTTRQGKCDLRAEENDNIYVALPKAGAPPPDQNAKNVASGYSDHVTAPVIMFQVYRE